MLINRDIKKIFGAKYYDKICTYIETIQNAIDSYDIVVFMARKAYCFYKALIDNKLIVQRDNCTILSSRAITYNGIDFSSKKIAIIEDVVILGDSLSEIIKEKNFDDVQLDVYMLACSKDFSIKLQNEGSKNKFNPTFVLENDELLELATLITNYIIYEMIPYNADYPVYCFNFSDYEELDCFFNNYNFYNITDLIHCKNNSITEGVIIPINNNYSSQILPKDNYIYKIRVYIDNNKKICYLVPIIIFYKLSSSEGEFIYNSLFLENYNSLCYQKDKKTYLKNKLRILCYKLAEQLLLNYMLDLIKYFDVKKNSSDIELFSGELTYGSHLSPDINSITNKNHVYVDGLVLYNSLGFAYDLLIDNLDLNSQNNKFKSEYISFDDIKEKIYIVERDPIKKHIISSLILDVFIDNGVIVPRVHFYGDSILRMFKFGEVANLTSYDFVLFAMLLNQYADNVKRMLDKTEIEKVSVIFFRNYNNNFNVENNEAEAYRICYSKFGPRISSSNVQYSVSQGQALTDVLISNGFIKQIGDKYNVIRVSQDEKYNRVKNVNRILFAKKLQKLYEFFTLAQKRDPSNKVFIYINSYIRLLTLISIGNNEKDKLLSLIAEVDLIKSKTLTKYDSLSLVVSVLNSIIDGVLSGIWKYFCYKNNNLLNKIFSLMCSASGEDNALFAIDTFLQNVAFENPIANDSFFDEIGCFLYEVAIFNYYLCGYTKTKIHDDYSKPPYKHFLDSKYFNDIHEQYKEAFSNNKEYIENYIFTKLKNIDNISCRILDNYQIYEATSSLNCDAYSECIVLFNFNAGCSVENIYHDLRTYRYRDILIIPIQKSSKEYILNEVCCSLNNIDVKALYYASNDKNILLYSAASKFYGKKFLGEINDVIGFLRTNIQPTVSKEFYILPKTMFNNREFQIENLTFKYIEKLNYYNQKCVYKYIFKENDKMNVTNFNVHGNMYNFEQITGDLNLLDTQCNDPEVQKRIKDAKDAAEKKDDSKLKACLKWLGENALDFISGVGANVLAELIKKSI